MAKKKKAATKNSIDTTLPNLVIESEHVMKNGLAEALGVPFNPFNLPMFGVPGGEQISQSTTLYNNLRWYLVSNFRQLLAQVYVEIGLIQTIVDVPVDDALRGGIEIKSKQLDEGQIEELQISLDRDNDINVAGQAAKWNRLFGGAGIIVLTDQDPELPLDLDSIGPDTPLEFRAVDMWELFWDKQNTEGYDPETQTEDFEHYDYYGEKIHKSRVMRLKGFTAPSFIRPRLRGWGFSVVEVLVRSINQYLKATDLGFEVLDEFKVDVYKIKNLVNTLLSPNGQEKIQKRIQLANRQKNYQNAVVIDGEDDWDHKQLSFAGLGEAMAGIRMQVASDLRMPLTKLFGISAAGFNSGEDDIEVYNSMVESQVRGKIKYDLLRMCEIKCQKLFGFVPDDLSLSFKPLRVLSAEQEENVKNAKFGRLLQARQAGELSTLEFRDAINRGNLLDITLDTSEDVLNPDDPEVRAIVKEGENDPNDPQDKDDPGTNREDTQKPKAGKSEYGANPPPPQKNATDKIKAWTREQRLERILKNSAEFDRASYEADGGDNWIDPRRAEFFQNPGNVDEALWSKAKEASVAAFGKVKWQFVTWWYKKRGGKFS